MFLYDRASWKLEQYALLPSGLDTGYAHMVPVSDDEMIIIYYSSHEYPLTERPTGHDSVPSDMYIASVSFEPVA